MIQRIQSLYLLLSLICLLLLMAGMSLYHIEVSKELSGFLDVYGYKWTNIHDKAIKYETQPFYLSIIALSILIVWTAMSYKKIKIQLKLIRLTLLIYFVVLLFFTFIPYLGKNADMGIDYIFHMGLGYIFLVVGFPFIFLANIGIKRDKNLLDSLNRLR